MTSIPPTTFSTGLLVNKNIYKILRRKTNKLMIHNYKISIVPLRKNKAITDHKQTCPLYNIRLRNHQKSAGRFAAASKYLQNYIEKLGKNESVNLTHDLKNCFKSDSSMESKDSSLLSQEDTIIILNDTEKCDNVEIIDLVNDESKILSASVISLLDDNENNTGAKDQDKICSSRTETANLETDSVENIATTSNEASSTCNLSQNIIEILDDSVHCTPHRKRKTDCIIDLCDSKENSLQKKRTRLNNSNTVSDIIDLVGVSDNFTNNNFQNITNKRSKEWPCINLINVHEVLATSTPKAVSHILEGSHKRPDKSNKTNKALIPSAKATATQSHTSNVGYNIYNPLLNITKTGLRPIIIDGSNVAVQHGIATGRKNFSVAGLEICIQYFEKRGHLVKTFIPHYRLMSNASTNPRRLQELEDKGKVVCTPSRNIRGKTISSYDDRYIVQTAAEFDGIIVSNDNYRDLISENAVWRDTIEKRLLMFTWVGDCLIFPLDPLGRHGPALDRFLQF